MELRSTSIEDGVLPASHELNSWCVGEPTGNRDENDDGFPGVVPIIDMPNEPARHDIGEPIKCRVYEAGLKGPEPEPL